MPAAGILAGKGANIGDLFCATPMVDFMPLVDCMERRMTASSSFLNQGERLQFLNSALSSMPIFFMGSLAVPAGILK